MEEQTKSYAYHELGTTPEFTSWIFASLNIQFPYKLPIKGKV